MMICFLLLALLSGVKPEQYLRELGDFPVMYLPYGPITHMTIPERPYCTLDIGGDFTTTSVVSWNLRGSKIPLKIECIAEYLDMSCYKNFIFQDTLDEEGLTSREFDTADQVYIENKYGAIETGEAENMFAAASWREIIDKEISDCSWLSTNVKRSKILSCKLMSDTRWYEPGHFTKSGNKGVLKLRNPSLEACDFAEVGTEQCLTRGTEVVCPHSKRMYTFLKRICENTNNIVYLTNAGTLISKRINNNRHRRDTNVMYQADVIAFYSSYLSNFVNQSVMDQLLGNTNPPTHSSRSKRDLKQEAVVVDHEVAALSISELNFQLSRLTVDKEKVVSETCRARQDLWDNMMSEKVLNCHKIHKFLTGSSKILCKRSRGGWDIQKSIPLNKARVMEAHQELIGGKRLVYLEGKNYTWEPVTGLLIPSNYSLSYSAHYPDLYLYTKTYMYGNSVEQLSNFHTTISLKYLSINKTTQNEMVENRLDQNAGWMSPISDSIHSKFFHQSLLSSINDENLNDVLSSLISLTYIKYIVVIIIVILGWKLFSFMRNPFGLRNKENYEQGTLM